jgi:hypothetical protein
MVLLPALQVIQATAHACIWPCVTFNVTESNQVR